MVDIDGQINAEAIKDTEISLIHLPSAISNFAREVSVYERFFSFEGTQIILAEVKVRFGAYCTIALHLISTT